MNTPKLILAECRNWFEDVHIPVPPLFFAYKAYGTLNS